MKLIMAFGLLVVLAATGALVAQAPTPQSAPERKPDSFTLINRALAAGQIDAETAHKYRVFAAFGDTRLPSAYDGDDHFADLPDEVEEAGRLLRTFSAQTQAELAPFFKRPNAPGSWVSLPTLRGQTRAAGAARGGPRSSAFLTAALARPVRSMAFGLTAAQVPRDIEWVTVPAVGGRVKGWAQTRHAGDADKAAQLAAAMTSKIWRDLRGLFGEPVSDANDDDNGGGPEFDIYLVRPTFGTDAFGHPEEPWKGCARSTDPYKECTNGSRYILLDSRMPLSGGTDGEGLLTTLAHEFAHAVTLAQPRRQDACEDYTWIREATGAWAEDFVYKNAQSEQRHVEDLLNQPKLPLDFVSPRTEEKHHYAAYLFLYGLVMRGHLSALPAMWQQFGKQKSLEGIDIALKAAGTSLEEEFPKFALDNWNRPPVDGYKRLDALERGAKVDPNPRPVTVPPGEEYERRLFTGLQYLSADYQYFSFDNTVKMVTFDNTLKGHPAASVWVIEKIKGQWQKPADLTKEDGKTWCRSKAEQDLEELVIILGNKQWKDKTESGDIASKRTFGAKFVTVEEDPLLKAYPVGCGAWAGTVSATYTMTGGALGTLTETVSARVRFDPDPELITEGEPVQYYMTVSGDLHWTAKAYGGECTGSHSGTVPITTMPGGQHFADFNLSTEDGKLLYAGGAGPWPDDKMPLFTYQCKDQSVRSSLKGAFNWWMTGTDKRPVSADGKTLSGTYEMPGLGPDSSLTYGWKIQAQ